MLRYLTVFLSGLLFALGLGISGMTLPQKVLAFLDFASDRWDPSLFLVMVTSAGTYLLLHRLVLARQRPVFDTKFYLPSSQDIDRRLLVGAALFGIGWGLVGFCPAPAVTALLSGSGDALVFFISMITGMYVYGTLEVIGSGETDGGVSGIDYLLGMGRKLTER